MFKNSLNIDQNRSRCLPTSAIRMKALLTETTTSALVSTGGYSASQLAENIDPGTIACHCCHAAADCLHRLSDYLQRLSDFGGKRHPLRYGLLKTIGTTPSQISPHDPSTGAAAQPAGHPARSGGRLVCRRRAHTGHHLPSDGIVSLVSLNPAIFIVSSLFSLFTVLLSCYRPGKIAAKGFTGGSRPLHRGQQHQAQEKNVL